MKQRLHQQIQRWFILQGVFLCLALSAMVIAYAFIVEDNIIRSQLQQEAHRIAGHYRDTGKIAAPAMSHLRLYDGWHQLPAAVRRLHAEEPGRIEFDAGRQGLHVQPVVLDDGRELVLAAHAREFAFASQAWPGALLLLLALSFALLAFACAGTFWRIRRAIEPLTALSAQLRSAGPETAMPDGLALPDNEIGHLADVIQEQWRTLHLLLQRERDFTRDVSHELRIPLTVLSNLHQLLQGQSRISAQQLELFGAMLAQQQGVIDVLFLLAREESLAREPVGLLGAIEHSILANPAVGARADLALDIAVDPGFAVRCQPRLLAILLGNLLDNALRHAGAPALSIRLRGSRLEFCNPSRGDRAGTSGGMGQGVSLARRICAVHGWDIETREADGTFVAAVSFGQGQASVKPAFASGSSL